MVDTNTGVSMKLNDAGVCQICGESRTLWDNELDVAICKACGQGELTPQPSDEELCAIYDSTYYDSWGEKDSSEAYWSMKKALF